MMMKRFLWIMVMVSWCNVGFAKEIQLAGLFSSDPYVQGCVEVRRSDGTWKCKHKTKKFYFNEGKNPGSEDRAWRKCGRAVEKIGKAKYKNFISGKNEGYYNYWCNPSD